MPAAARRAFLTEIYSPAGLNLNMGRCCIGSSDYSRSIYSYDDVLDDMNLDHFSLRHDEAYILPVLREVREINPNLFLKAAPWSPPGWMKTYGTTFGGRTTENYLGPYAHGLWELSNGSMVGKGGWMSEKYLGVYAQYLWKFLQGYAQAGVPVQALTAERTFNRPGWEDASLSLVTGDGGGFCSGPPGTFVARAAPAESDLAARS
jgi:glucosylceramidase